MGYNSNQTITGQFPEIGKILLSDRNEGGRKNARKQQLQQCIYL